MLLMYRKSDPSRVPDKAQATAAITHRHPISCLPASQTPYQLVGGNIKVARAACILYLVHTPSPTTARCQHREPPSKFPCMVTLWTVRQVVNYSNVVWKSVGLLEVFVTPTSQVSS